MAMRNIITFALSALFVLGLVAGASAGIPDTNNSDAWAENCGRHTMAPCGGEALNDAAIPQDYTIHAIVRDINGTAVAALPATDMSLLHGNMAHCVGSYSQADQATDGTGYTMFSMAPGLVHGGITGDAADGVDCDVDTAYSVYALGIILNSANPVCVTSDSPDLNGDLAVTVADFGKYASDFNVVGGDPCHDYNEDGANTVADFAIFAGYFNSCVCP